MRHPGFYWSFGTSGLLLVYFPTPIVWEFCWKVQGLVVVHKLDQHDVGDYPIPDEYGPLAPTPKQIASTLKDHQSAALHWLLLGDGKRILADDMGPGKTLTALTSLCSLHGQESLGETCWFNTAIKNAQLTRSGHPISSEPFRALHSLLMVET